MRAGAVLSIALVAIFSLIVQSQAAVQLPVMLTYEPLLQPGSQKFSKIRVSLRFAGDSDGRSEIDLPNEWGGFTRYYENIDNIRTQGAKLQKGAAPDKLILTHKPGAVVTLSYEVKGVNRPDRLAIGETGNEYRPIVNADYFHLIGESVVPKPVHISGDAPARFVMKSMPDGKRFASDMEHATKGLLKFDALVESITVGGDFRILTAGNGARLAIRGKFDSRTDTQWIEAFQRVSKAVSSYWESDAGPYLVTILPFEPSAPGSVSIGGTGRRDAFAFFATTNGSVDTLDQIMTHEMVHSWMPRRVGGIAFDDIKQKEQYWLSEGFTDFVTWRALVRAGVWTPERYIQELNTALAEYDANPNRAKPNVETAKLFWASREGQRIAYLRGALFALLLDDQLQAQKKPSSLRTVLLAMQRDAARSGVEGQAIALLRKRANLAGAEIGKLISRHIDSGELVMFPSDFMVKCASYGTRTQAKFHRGFDIQKTQAEGNIIAGVIEDGPAWRAGLRNGMKMVGRSGGAIGNSQVEIAYDVEIDGQKRTLRWMPQSQEREILRTLVPDRLDDPARRTACIAMLSR